MSATLSVVVPSLNQGHFIGETLDQRLRQLLDRLGAMAAGDRQQQLQRGQQRSGGRRQR